jgi:hypothetical protein
VTDAFTEPQLTVLQLVVEDGTPFGMLAQALTAEQARLAVSDLWRRGLVAIERIEELDDRPHRPVSALTPDVRSTSRLSQESLGADDAAAAIEDERNWRHLTGIPAERSWYEVTATTETEAAYLAAAWAKHNED